MKLGSGEGVVFVDLSPIIKQWRICTEQEATLPVLSTVRAKHPSTMVQAVVVCALRRQLYHSSLYSQVTPGKSVCPSCLQFRTQEPFLCEALAETLSASPNYEKGKYISI